MSEQCIVDQEAPDSRRTANRQRIERVEAAEGMQTHTASLGRVRIDIVEMSYNFV